MLTIVDSEAWIKYLQTGINFTIFDTQEWIENISESFKLKANYYFYIQEGKTVLGFVIFTSGKRIKLPNHIFFSSIVFNPKFSENVISDIFTASIAQLSKEFNVLNFKLRPELRDSRAFIWNNFSVTPKYTYWVDLADTKYHERVYRVLKKEQMNSYSYFENKDISLNLDKQFGFVPKKEKSMNHIYTRHFIEKMIKLNNIIVFSAYNENVLCSSYIVIIDRFAKIGYGIMLYTVPEFAKTGVTSGLHDYVFNYMSNLGILQFDLCGGNFQQISAFKRGFNPNLKMYFETSKDNRFGKGKLGTMLVDGRNTLRKFLK